MANLSNINNKFLFTNGDFLKIGNLAPINNISGTESGISITNGNVASITLDNTAASGKTFVIYSDDGGTLNFYDVDASSGRLVIDSSGRVGINDTISGNFTTNYDTKLLVGGEIIARSLTASASMISIGGDATSAFIKVGKQDGSLTARPLRIEVGTSEVMNIDSSGNSTFAGNVTLTKAIGDTELLIEADTNNNNENYNPRLHLRQDGGAISSYFGLNGDADNTFTGALANGAYIKASGSIQFAPSNTLALSLDTSQNATFAGNVNVGGGFLEVIDPVSGNFSGEIKVGGAGSSRRLLLKQDTVLEYLIGAEGSDSLLKFGTGTGAAERMRIGSNGYVGMGMDNNNNQRLALAQADQNGSHIRMNNSRAGGGYFVIGVGDSGSTSSITPAGGLFFYNGATRMVINSSGQVGIGTASPGAKLEINDGPTQTELRISVTGDTGYSTLNFADASDINPGQIYYHHQLNLMNFRTNDSDRMQIESDGTVRVKTGSILVETAGQGIYLGGTAAANNLDDYEEGTWTPTLKFNNGEVGITYAGAAGSVYRGGHYTKIGRVVTFSFRIILTSKGTSTGDATISGLPYDVGGLNGNYGSAMYSFANNFLIPLRPTITIDSSSSIIRLRFVNSPNGNYGNITNSDFNNNSDIILTGVYQTA